MENKTIKIFNLRMNANFFNTQRKTNFLKNKNYKKNTNFFFNFDR